MKTILKALKSLHIVYSLWSIHVTDLMKMGKTTNVPKSALHYKLEKPRFPDLETWTNPVLFSQNLKKVERELNVIQLRILVITFWNINCQPKWSRVAGYNSLSYKISSLGKIKSFNFSIQLVYFLFQVSASISFTGL